MYEQAQVAPAEQGLTGMVLNNGAWCRPAGAGCDMSGIY